jgi:MFS superfamily sulfate permease-like transporter
MVDADESPEAQPVPGVLVLRLEEPLFFANADTLLASVLAMAEEAAAPVRAVVLDLETTFGLDVPGADMIRQLAAELGRHGITLSLARVHPDVRQVLVRTGAVEAVAGLYPRTIDAVRAVSSD